MTINLQTLSKINLSTKFVTIPLRNHVCILTHFRYRTGRAALKRSSSLAITQITCSGAVITFMSAMPSTGDSDKNASTGIHRSFGIVSRRLRVICKLALRELIFVWPTDDSMFMTFWLFHAKDRLQCGC